MSAAAEKNTEKTESSDKMKKEGEDVAKVPLPKVPVQEVRVPEVRLVNKILEIQQYQEVKDKRNVLKSSGGKSYGPFGRIIEESKSILLINNDLNYKGSKRRYVVAMNCQREKIPVENVLKKFHELISPESFYRLALLLGINEKVTMKHPINYKPTVEEVLSEEIITILKNLNIPVMVVYYQWTTYRDLPYQIDTDNLRAQKVREELFKLISTDREVLQYMLDEEEKANHKFPFGSARNFLLNNNDSKKFVSSLHQNNCQVYIHIQDSDVVLYRQNLIFTDFLLGTTSLIPRNIKHLLDKCDILIDHVENQNGFPPLFVGGAHTYTPAENLTDLGDQFNTLTSKYFTRFVSEMSNIIRHMVGQQQPYGIYFHEPNCLVLSPPSAKRMETHERLPEDIKTAYKKLTEGFTFGNDSEMQGFTRKIFTGLDDNACCKGMIFSATIVLATSMKRGNKGPFTVEFDGKFDPSILRFCGWTKNPLTSMNSMSQEIIHPNKWVSMVTSSFTSHKKRGSLSLITNVLKLFTPIMTPSKSFESPYSEEEQKTKASELFHSLTGNYNEMVAFQIMTLAWETGQSIRLVLSKHLTNQPTSRKDQNIIAFLSKRINYEEVGENPFVLKLLERDYIPKTIIVREDKVLEFAQYLMKVFKENKSKTAKALKIDPETLNKLLSDDTYMTARKRIAKQLDTEQNVLALLSEVSVSEEMMISIFCLLGLRNHPPTTN